MKTDGKRYPTPFQLASCWAALCGLSLVVVIGLVVAMLYGFGQAFMALEPVLLPVVIAGMLAYLLSPIVAWTQRFIRKRLLAVLLVMCTVGVVVAAMINSFAPKLIDQTGELISKRDEIVQSGIQTCNDLLEHNEFVQQGIDMVYQKTLKDARSSDLPEEDVEELSNLQTYHEKALAILNFNSSYLTDKVLNWLTAGSRALSGVTFFLIGAVMVPVFLFYFLLESEKIASNWHTILPLRRSHFRIEVVETLLQINGYIISFVRGQMLVSLIDGVLLGIALKILGLPYAVTIGFTAAILGIIPYIGMISTSIPAMLIAWFTWNDINYVLGVAAIFFGISQFDGWVIQPRIVGNRVGMHDLTVMFSVLFWSLVLGGAVGALLAVPLTASIKVIFMRYVWPSLQTGKRRRQRRAFRELARAAVAAAEAERVPEEGTAGAGSSGDDAQGEVERPGADAGDGRAGGAGA